MHSEHIRDLHPFWVIGGWLVAVAVAGAVFMVLVGVGIAQPGVGGMPLMVLASVAIGFFAGGLFVGLRWSNAPILNAAAVTFLSILAWFLAELVLPGAVGRGGLELRTILGLVLLILLASTVGGWTGRRLVRRGETPSLES